MSGTKKEQTESVAVPKQNQRGKSRYGHHFSDMSDNIGTQRPTATAKGHVIHWYSVATGATVHFKAFLTNFQDQYTSDWSDMETFGRMDPISTFKKTGRVISLAWDVPSASVEEARFNLREAERFISMLYPVYEEYTVSANIGLAAGVDRVELDSSGTEDSKKALEVAAAKKILSSKGGTSQRQVGVMVAPPLFKLKFANLIMDNSDKASIRGGASLSGLTGKLSGLSYEPDIEQGFFGHTGIDDVGAGVLIPQTIKFSCEFTVLHTSPLGWNPKKTKGGNKRSRGFPYHSRDITKNRGN